MLRRKPTALTVTSEDIASFEEMLSRRVAYAKYIKTGEDPEGYFSGTGAHDTQMSEGQAQQERDASVNAGVAIDPNDELKPLPGDKARIVRRREERIVGTGAGAGAWR